MKATPEAIMNAWNDAVGHVAELANVRGLSPKRRTHLRQRIVDFPDLQMWVDAFDLIATSLFCRGLKGWRITFDAICERSDLVLKAAEGKYTYTWGDAPTLEAKAKSMRGVGSRCPHEPACPDRQECLLNLVFNLFDDGMREPQFTRRKG